MATKVAVSNRNAPDLSGMFNWGVKISNFTELFLLAGHGAVAPDMQVQNPGDPIGQTRYILDGVKSFLEENDYSLDDIVRMEQKWSHGFRQFSGPDKWISVD